MMKKEYDLIVAGGGPGGVCASIAAAERGLSVLLIEKYGFAGGMATAGLVNPFMSYKSAERNLANPVFNKIIAGLKERGAIDNQGLVFDDEELKPLLDDMLIKAGVEILFHAQVIDAKSSNGKISSITAALKSGLQDFKARVFIDSTGDGDIAAFAGFKYEKGRHQDGACQPATLCFRAGGVKGLTGNLHEIRKELTAIYLKGKEKGEISDPRENVLLFKTLQDNVIHFNTTRVIGKDHTTSEGLTESEIIARKQVYEIINLFKRESPCFKNAYILKIAAQTGIRETRRVIGHYLLEEDEIVSGKIFDDGIARSNYPVDIHNPSGTGTVLKRIEREFYEIPYRCLVPAGSRNLIMGCRALSSTHEAHSSLRVMPVIASVGEAAGRAAVKSLEKSCDVSEVKGSELKREIFSDEQLF